jgi:cytochrome bd-type quinol oxidase subunit 1
MIGYKVLVTFSLDATFPSVLLFGWERVPPWLHTLSAIAVAAGTLLSAFWILSANSWMQTPAGYEMRDGIAYPLDWLATVFNDESAETNRFAVTIPHGASLVLTHSWDGLCPGLKSVPPRDLPPVVPPFFAFRIMVGIGLLIIVGK